MHCSFCHPLFFSLCSGHSMEWNETEDGFALSPYPPMTSLLCLSLSFSLPLLDGWGEGGTPLGCSKKDTKALPPLRLAHIVPPPIGSLLPKAKAVRALTQSHCLAHSLPLQKGWSLTTIGCVCLCLPSLFLFLLRDKKGFLCRTPLLPPVQSVQSAFSLFVCFLGRRVCHLFSSFLHSIFLIASIHLAFFLILFINSALSSL
jgi:hypothetical protein